MSSDRRLPSLAQRGFTLVALMIVVILLNIAVATAMQLWSKVAQREKEEELIFRGLQYAEAIRVFQQRFGRPPTTLEELLELKPRAIRQLWTDPLSDSGGWEPILAGSGSEATPVAQGNAPGQAPGGRPGERRRSGRPGTSQRQVGSGGSSSENRSGTGEQLSRAFDEAAGLGGSSFGEDAEETQVGPLEGVKPTASGAAMKHFLGREDYGSWEFRAAMLAEPRVSPEGVPLTPRLDPSALGRPFPDWLTLPGAEPHPVEGEGTPEGPDGF